MNCLVFCISYSNDAQISAFSRHDCLYGDIAPLILKLLIQLMLLLNPRAGRCATDERTPGTHRVGCLVGPIIGLNLSTEQIIFLHLANLSSRQPGHSTGYGSPAVRTLVIDWLIILFRRAH